ncbi:MAG TPA: tRNA lysidine(34) synthetase TilS [Luteolibacter sp.]|nr:tRNA lysidine(34) synthetase TilS [Luteolibacter sp.]
MNCEFHIPWTAQAARRARWLVGVSGGADSVALLHLLHRADFRNLVVCHLDHRLRGRASTADARFVERLAAKLGLKCESARRDVREMMKQSGESMETAARRARHEFFAACTRKHRCRRVLLAHHADDQAETVLWNLLRGSHGLKGMRDEQEITVGGFKLELIRPLLDIRRADLVAWLRANRLKWREDASNLDAIAVRNRLRHEALPLLAEISGRDPVAALVRSVQDMNEREEMECELVQQSKLLDPQGRLHLGALRALPPPLQRRAIAEFLTNHGIAGIDRALLDRALVLTDPNAPPAINLPGGRQLRRRAGRLFVTPP